MLHFDLRKKRGRNGTPSLNGKSRFSRLLQKRSDLMTRAVCEALEMRRMLSTASPQGITPQQMRHAYGVDQIGFAGVTGNGAGQTIAILETDHDPSALSDLEQFDSQLSLPDPPSFQQLAPGNSFPTENAGGTGEEALDMEWAHAMAPGANIDLIEASSLVSAVTYAETLPAVSVVSTSVVRYGISFSQDDPDFTTPAGHISITFVASTGDIGAYLNNSPEQYPATSPNVVAVGGTYLSTSGSAGNYGSESAGNGGGGVSQYELQPQPSFQANPYGKANPFSSTYRTVPDVSMDMSPVPFCDSTEYTTSLPWSTVGGTSLSAPMFAGLMAIVDQGRALAGLPTLDGPTQTLFRLYGLPSADYHDITTGTTATPQNNNQGYAALTGYDLATGLGSPVANLLVPGLAFQASDFSASSFIVTNTNDSGTGSLRQAIIDSDLYYQGIGQSENITFNIPTSDPNYSNGDFSIKPQSVLPTITGPSVTIDGSSEPNSATLNGGRPVIFLNGAGQNISGLVLAAGSDVVKDLGIDSFASTGSGGGVVLSGTSAQEDSVTNCLIGIGPGSAASAGNSIGVLILTAGTNFVTNDVIGFNTDGISVVNGSGDYITNDSVGISSGASAPNGTGIVLAGPTNIVYDNQIGDNTGDGISISGSASTGNQLQDNTIGVEYESGTYSGYYPAPNGVDGILIGSSASGEVIGGTATGNSNLIAGNTGYGVEIDSSSGNYIEQNVIGEASHLAAGNQTVYNPNGKAGIYLHDSSTNNAIGGTQAIAANEISGNDGEGIDIADSGSSGNTIQGNYIGTDSAGDSVGNIGFGILSGGQNEEIESNVISGNTNDGIELTAGPNYIAFNDIGTNPTGTAALPNQFDGLLIASGSQDDVAHNTISGNGFHGVVIESSSNTLESNSIGLNSASAAAIPNSAVGVLVTGTDNAISNDVISGNGSAGIALEGNDNSVSNCSVGINQSGGAVSNGGEGIYIDSSGNQIGTGFKNAISGNTAGNGCGILLDASSATGNSIAGNLIGTNFAGTVAVPNYNGIVVQNGATGNFIGSAAYDVGNVISGNTNDGIYIASSAGANNLITTNYIGINAAGTASIGNQNAGIEVDANNVVIGGTTPNSGNTISGNSNGSIYTGNHGIYIVGGSGDVVEGNYIGTNPSGTAAIAGTVMFLGSYIEQYGIWSNGSGASIIGNLISGNSSGIYLDGSSSSTDIVQGNMIGTDITGNQPVANGNGIVVINGNMTIGGSATGQGNTIDYNTNLGIEIVASGLTTITDSTVYDNSGPGIFNEGTIAIINCTIAGNSGQSGGGIQSASGAVTIDDTTIYGNAASNTGGGIDVAGGTLVLKDTIVAQNSGGDITGAVSSSSSYNLIGNGSGLTGISNGVSNNQVGTAAVPINPQLGSLANNGGTTETLLPANNSPALNTGVGIISLSTDQRGGSRPTSGAVDIGAVQLQGNHVIISNAAIYLRLESDGQTLDIYYNNTGIGTPAATYVLANLASLAASSSSGNSQFTVDFSNGSPVPAGSALSYNPTGGGNTMKLIGSAGNDTIGIGLLGAFVGNSSFTYTDVQNRIVDPLTGSDSLSINSTTTVSFPVSPTGGGIVTRNLSSLSLGIGGHLVVPTASAHTDRTLLIIQSATLGASAGIDLGGNDADFTTTPLITVKGWLTTGYASGNWSGTGIDSSFASVDTTHLSALGVIQNNQSGSALFTSSNAFDNITPGAADVLVKYTYYGDSNLDGIVDGSDYTRVDNGYLNHLSGWLNGDFNYDGIVNGSDYTLIDNAFNTQGVTLASQIKSHTTNRTAELPLQSASKGASSTLSKTQVDQSASLRTFIGNPASFIPSPLFSSSPVTLVESTEPGIESLLQKKDLLDGLSASTEPSR